MAVPVFVGDRVLISTDTTGTGTYNLGTAVAGYLSPDDAGLSTGIRVAYVVVDSLTNPSIFEIGEGTYTAGTPATISRALIVRNSSGGTTAVSWSAGTKYLFLALSASRFVIYATDGGLVLNDAGISGVASINSGPLAGFRNAVINGNFNVWQRGTSFSSPAAGAYGSDRWLINFDGSGATRTISRQAFTLGQTAVPGEPSYFYRFGQSVAGSGGASNFISQRIEDVRTFAGRQVTLSFYAKAAASLTMPAIIFRQYFGSGGSPSAYADAIVGAPTVVGTSFTKHTFTVTLPSISGKTLGTDGVSMLELILLLPLNTTFTFDIAQVQLELGSVATPFERRPLGVELQLCQRYFQFVSTLQAGITDSGATNSYRGRLTVNMRSTPTVVIVGTTNINTTGATVLTVGSEHYDHSSIGSASGGFISIANANLNAEL